MLFMKSKHIQRVLRFLVIVIGAGAGVALAFLCVQVHRMTTANAALPFLTLALLYVGMGGLGALLGHVLAPKVIAWCGEATAAAVRAMEDMTLPQLTAMLTGLITGLIVAALLTQVLNFLGDSIFTLAFSALLYVVLGMIGMAVGKSRTDDFAAQLSHLPSMRERRASKKNAAEGLPAKVLDGAVLSDGRIEAVLKTGFIEGELLLPDFVVAELRDMATSEEASRRVRGQRGLAAVERLQADESVPLRVLPTENAAPADMETRLTALARTQHAALLTSDLSLTRSARLLGLPVLNLNDLAVSLRTVTAAGDVLAVKLTKEGREATQGVGYLEDGTMLVVEGGRAHIGETVEVTVTSVLQTSAGRMVFAKMN